MSYDLILNAFYLSKLGSERNVS